MGKRKSNKKLNDQSSPITENDTCKGCKNEESHINWLCCDVCKGWWHCVCASVRVADANKMKSQKIKYVCAYCVLAKLKPQTHSNQPNESISSKPQEEIDSKQNDAKFEIIQNPTSSHDIVSSNNNNQISVKSVSISVNSDAAKSTTKGCKGSIVIIDGIRNSQNFSNSSLIKKEIKTYKNLNIKFTYQLSRGGIVVHTDTEEEVNSLKSSWDPKAFSNSGEFLKVHEVQPRYRCVLKNVPEIVSE